MYDVSEGIIMIFFESKIRFEKIGPSMLVNSQFHKTLIPDLQVFSENHSYVLFLFMSIN